MLIIDPKIDTAVYVFEHLFLCRIPNLESMSADYIRHFGMPTTGDKQLDRDLSMQDITTMLPISKMAEYHSTGVAIKIVNRGDVKDIYDIVTLHLGKWKKHLEVSYNLGEAPLDDLMTLDNFATAVYNEAKYDYEQGVVTSEFLQHMSSTVRLNKKNFFKTNSPVGTLDKEGNLRVHGPEDKTYPERDSMLDILRNRKIGNKSW